MECIHHNPLIYLIEIPFTNLSTHATNCYLIQEGNDTLVVDTGAPTQEGYALLRDALKELAVDDSHLSFFLTHLHFDHAGLIDSITSPQTNLYVSTQEYERTQAHNRSAHARTLKHRFLAEGASEEEVTVSYELQNKDSSFINEEHSFTLVDEGDVITVGAYHFDVIDTAGHTSGHLSLFEKSQGILLGGDHILFTLSPSIDWFPAERSCLDIYLDNLKKVRSLPLTTLLHSHGPLRQDFNERIDWLEKHHQRRLDETLGIVIKTPGLSGIEIIRAIRWNTHTAIWEDIPPLQRSIIITQGLVLLDHLVANGTLLRKENDGTLHYYPR